MSTLAAKVVMVAVPAAVGSIGLHSLVPALFGAALSGLMAWFWFARNAKVKKLEKEEVRQDEQTKRIAALETQLALVGQQVLPLSAAWQKYLIEQLTHLHTPELDAAMKNIGSQTEAEEARMLEMLAERRTDMDDRIDPAERVAAEMLPLVLKFIRLETEDERLKVPEVIAVAKAIPETPQHAAAPEATTEENTP